MKKPLIRTADWDDAFPDKWSINKAGLGVNSWGVFPPFASPDRSGIKWFGSHAAAVRHLVKKGWKK